MSSDVRTGKRISRDIRPCELGSLDWGPGRARQSLDEVYKHVVETASRACEWYVTAKRPKKRWAQLLRVAAIIMVAVAGVLPVLSQILGSGGSVVIQPAWATVALTIAIALIGLDRFFGFSSAWARYITAGHAILGALDQFRIDWQRSSSKLPADGLNGDSIGDLLDLAKEFLKETDGIMLAEARQWASEFRETLIEIEKSAGHKAG